MRQIMPMVKNVFRTAGNRVFERPVRISSLAISPSAEDLSFLEHKFNEANWKLYTASTYREALAALGHYRVPVVLCDCQLPDGDWKDVLSQLAPLPDRPRLIAFSRNANEKLWAEVLSMGGFDLLATPFREEELVFALGSAWLDWQGERERGALRTHSRAC